jgi:hypothetical protein
MMKRSSWILQILLVTGKLSNAPDLCGIKWSAQSKYCK